MTASFRARTAAAFVLGLFADPLFAQAPEPSPTPSAQSEVMKALPVAGSLTARVVQLNAGLVLEREEGAGLFPAEPSRFSFRGGSWTQSRIEIDGFDVTDPLLGGRPLVWSPVELGEVDVRTDSKGTAITYTRPPDGLGIAKHFVAQGTAGVFDSSGSTKDPIPSLARGHHLYDGFVAATSSSADKATTFSGAVSDADASRSERDSDAERPTRSLGLDGSLRHQRGDDTYRLLAMYRDTRAPFGFTSDETKGKGLFAGAEWQRVEACPDCMDRISYTRASFRRGEQKDAPLSSRAFERLVDGPPATQAPFSSNEQKVELQSGVVVSRGDDFGRLSLDFSRATSERRLAQPSFQSFEFLNGVAARMWSWSEGTGARVSELRAGLRLDWSASLSKRSRFGGSVGVLHARAGDRDGDSILTTTRFVPSVRYEWRKSDDTRLTLEGSIDAPAVPLLSYEPAAIGVPALSARLWTDLNRDGHATPNELGAEVARRGPGSTTADPDLKLPSIRRVSASFETRSGAVHIRTTGYIRQDRNLIETALDPRGFEISSTRQIGDPSGDILGPSDDQLLPFVDENTRSFTSSRYVLTNPDGHDATGEGVELAIETHATHVHWGVRGAAFLDKGQGGNRGLRVNENDFGVVGESFDRTNADTFGEGRLFFDRAYSLKMFLTANNVAGFTFGAIGRYDDGQPFARLVIRNDAPQGPDFVQAIPRGRARLHYTLSVDARLSRKFSVQGANVELIAQVFNALGSKFEAEEQVVWQDDYRRITMVQPPRAFTFGVRIAR